MFILINSLQLKYNLITHLPNTNPYMEKNLPKNFPKVLIQRYGKVERKTDSGGWVD